MLTRTQEKYDVGGVLLPQPFKVRRLGHFGVNITNSAECLDFYCETLGFRVSDPLDVADRPVTTGQPLKDTKMAYFMRHGTDHHSFVLINSDVLAAIGRKEDLPPDVTVNQMTWQVASLAEVGRAIDYFNRRGVKMARAGRDMPGSNWHCYFYDPEGHRNELYYGMEQVGWSGASKPKWMHARGFRERPPLPQIPEYQEVEQALEKGVDLNSGFRHPEVLPPKYDVDGILLPRPFKIVRHGPIRLFCHDVRAMESFYADVMGFQRTEELNWEGHRCVFLRCNTEHHAIALYPVAIRERLGWPPKTTIMSFGVQVATYRQLRDAVKWLKERGCTLLDVPAELTPGIDYSVYVRDPAGHPIQVYYYMEQVGWDGCVRGKRPKPSTRFEEWPEALEPQTDTYMGEQYLGPWG
jgi:catechol 2,3-dioxygenase-like lactoylglutathione lyase family enzyme